MEGRPSSRGSNYWQRSSCKDRRYTEERREGGPTTGQGYEDMKKLLSIEKKAINIRRGAQDRPESKQILAKLAGKNQHLRKANISEVGSLCSGKFLGRSMYSKKAHRWTEWPRGSIQVARSPGRSLARSPGSYYW